MEVFFLDDLADLAGDFLRELELMLKS